MIEDIRVLRDGEEARDFLLRGAKVGDLVVYHGVEHIVVKIPDQGLRLAGLRITTVPHEHKRMMITCEGDWMKYHGYD